MKIPFICLASALLIHACDVFGQISLDNLMTPPFPTNMVASKDGSRIAWIFNDRGVRNIFGAESPDFSARKLTQHAQDDGIEISSLVFAADRLIFVKGGSANRQCEYPNPLSVQDNMEQSVWSLTWKGDAKKIGKGSDPQVSPDGSTVAYLSGDQIWSAAADGSSESKKIFQARGTQLSVRWSPDGGKLAFISSRGDHSFLGIVDLQTSAVSFLDPSFDYDTNPVWSPDGKQIAYIRSPHVTRSLPFFSNRDGQPWSIRIVEIASGAARQIWSAAEGKGSVLFKDIPSIDNLLFWIDDKIIFPWERTGWVHMYSVSDKGGEPKELTPGEGEIEHVSLSLDRESLLAVTNITDINRRHLWRIDPNGSPKQLSKGQGIEWSEAETTNGVACLRSDAVTVAWPHLVGNDGQTKMLATNLFPNTYPKDLLVTPEPVEITGKDGMKAYGQLFLPKAHKTGEKHPAIVYFHGGSRRQMLLGFHYSQYYHNAYAMNQYLASLGYIVLALNYRSGIGYGLDFREALDYGAGGASEYNDVVGAGLYLRQRQDVESKRMGLWGGSYGGYLTAMGLARNSDMFACGVDIHGVHDWNPVIKNFVPAYDPSKWSDISKKAYESSPLNFVKGWKSPVLLVHGDDDRNVPFNESVTLVEALRKQHVYFEQLILPDEVHFFLLHDSWVRTYKASAAFFQQEFRKIK